MYDVQVYGDVHACLHPDVRGLERERLEKLFDMVDEKTQADIGKLRVFLSVSASTSLRACGHSPT